MGIDSTYSTSSALSAGLNSMQKLESKGGRVLLERILLFFGQFRDRCPCSLHRKHFPAASSSEHSEFIV